MDSLVDLQRLGSVARFFALGLFAFLLFTKCRALYARQAKHTTGAGAGVGAGVGAGAGARGDKSKRPRASGSAASRSREPSEHAPSASPASPLTSTHQPKRKLSDPPTLAAAGAATAQETFPPRPSVPSSRCPPLAPKTRQRKQISSSRFGETTSTSHAQPQPFLSTPYRSSHSANLSHAQPSLSPPFPPAPASAFSRGASKTLPAFHSPSRGSNRHAASLTAWSASSLNRRRAALKKRTTSFTAADRHRLARVFPEANLTASSNAVEEAALLEELAASALGGAGDGFASSDDEEADLREEFPRIPRKRSRAFSKADKQRLSRIFPEADLSSSSTASLSALNAPLDSPRSTSSHEEEPTDFQHPFPAALEADLLGEVGSLSTGSNTGRRRNSSHLTAFGAMDAIVAKHTSSSTSAAAEGTGEGTGGGHRRPRTASHLTAFGAMDAIVSMHKNSVSKGATPASRQVVFIDQWSPLTDSPASAAGGVDPPPSFSTTGGAAGGGKSRSAVCSRDAPPPPPMLLSRSFIRRAKLKRSPHTYHGPEHSPLLEEVAEGEGGDEAGSTSATSSTGESGGSGRRRRKRPSRSPRGRVKRGWTLGGATQLELEARLMQRRKSTPPSVATFLSRSSSATAPTRRRPSRSPSVTDAMRALLGDAHGFSPATPVFSAIAA